MFLLSRLRYFCCDKTFHRFSSDILQLSIFNSWILLFCKNIFHSWILLFCNNGEGSASAPRLLRPPHWFAFFSKNDPLGDDPAGDGNDDDGVRNDGDDGRDFLSAFCVAIIAMAVVRDKVVLCAIKCWHI